MQGRGSEEKRGEATAERDWPCQAVHAFVPPSVRSFTQQTSVGHLPCARCLWRVMRFGSCPTCSLEGETDMEADIYNSARGTARCFGNTEEGGSKA